MKTANTNTLMKLLLAQDHILKFLKSPNKDLASQLQVLVLARDFKLAPKEQKIPQKLPWDQVVIMLALTSEKKLDKTRRSG